MKIEKNYFKQDFYKLMYNYVFGKTIENIMKQVNINMVTNYFR